MKSSQRDTYFDFLRGLAIIFVVGIHTRNQDIVFHSTIGTISILTMQIIGCAVPLFLAISGFFLVKKTVNSTSGYFSFLKKQIPIVYIPCLFFSTPYFLLQISSGNPFWKSFISFFICGYSVYYFIALIIQCYILLPIVKGRNFIFNLFLLIVSLFCTYLIIKYNIMRLPTIFFAGPFPTYLVFFSLGCWLGYKKREYSLTLVLIFWLMSLGLCLYETNYLYDTYNIPAIGMKPSVHIHVFFTILVLFHTNIKKLYKENRFTKHFCILGIDSFAIYLIHLLVAMVLFRIPYINNLWLLKWILLLLTSWLIVIIIKRVIPTKLWKYLGLR